MKLRSISKAFFLHRYVPCCLDLLVSLWQDVGEGGMKFLTMRLDMVSLNGEP